MSLTTSNSILGKKNAKHLLKRACFHYSKEVLDSISIMTPLEALSFLENHQPNTWTEPYDPLPSDDPHGYWISSDYLPNTCLLYTSPSPRDRTRSRMPSSA